MAQFFTDFSEYQTEELPSDWTKYGDVVSSALLTVQEDGSATGGKVLRLTDSPVGVKGALWDTPSSEPDSAQVEVLTKVRINIPGAADFSPCICRSLTDLATAYQFQFLSNQKRIRRQSSNIASKSEAVTSDWYYVRGQSFSNNIKMKWWLAGQPEPSTWQLEVTDTATLGTGVGLNAFMSFGDGEWCDWDIFSVGTNGDPAPIGPIDEGESGQITSSASSSDAWAISCQSATSLSAGAVVSDNLNAIASVNTSIIAAAQASDSSGEFPAASGRLSSAATGSNTLDALANAAAAISAGAAAGESWTVQAQVVANLLEQGVAADQIDRQTESAINAALAEQSAAADQFVAAVNVIASLTDTASANDAYVALVAQLGSIASGAIASDTFRTTFGLLRTLQSSAQATDNFSLNFGYLSALQSGALSGDAWALMVSMTAALSEACTADDLLQAKAMVTTRVRAGAVATARFAIVNAGIRYLVMGSIILRDALNYRVTHKPALNQSVKIKPGH